MSMLAQERQNLCLSKPSNIPGLIKLPQIVPHIRRNGLNHNQPYILNLGKLVENALQISKDDHTLKHRRQLVKVGNSQANENEPTVAKIRFKKKNISKALPYKGLLQNVALSKKKISPLKRNILQARKEKLEASNNNVSTSTDRLCEIKLENTKTCDIIVDKLAQLITNLVMSDALEVAKQLNPNKGSDSKLINGQKVENQSEAKLKSGCPELEESIGELNRLNTLKREAGARLKDNLGEGCAAHKDLQSRADRSLLESYILENGSHVTTTLPTPPSGLGQGCCTNLLLRACAEIKASTHKPKFRDYCDHYVEKELSCAAVDLVSTLLNFYKRKLVQNPDKARNPEKKRLVFGMKEIIKLIRLDKVKCIILAPDIESVPGTGGLDQRVKELVDNASVRKIPIVFGIRRNEMSRIYRHNRVNISAIGLLNYQGAEAKYQALMEMVEVSRKRYKDNFLVALNTSIQNGLDDNAVIQTL